MAARRLFGQRLDQRCPINWRWPINTGVTGLVFAPCVSAPLPGWGGGTTVRDMVRGAKLPSDGTFVNGVKWDVVAGRRCWTFNGGNGDHVNFGNSTTLDMAGDLSILLWIYPTLSVGRNQILFGKTASGDSFSNYDFYIHGDHDLCWWDQSTEHSSGYAPTLNVWTHVAAVRSGTSVIFYANGQSVATVTVTVRGANTGNLLLGEDSANQPYQGSESDPLLFGRALSATEVQVVYLESLAKNPNSWNWLPPVMSAPAAAAAFAGDEEGLTYSFPSSWL